MANIPNTIAAQSSFLEATLLIPVKSNAAKWQKTAMKARNKTENSHISVTALNTTEIIITTTMRNIAPHANNFDSFRFILSIQFKAVWCARLAD